MKDTLPTGSPGRKPADGALPGARAALTLLLLINLFNYIDRYVLAAVVGSIQKSYFGSNGISDRSALLGAIQDWSQRHLGFKPELAIIGLLSTAFLVIYMVGAPVFGRLAERHSRWVLIGIGVLVWSLASGASGLAPTFFALLAARCLVGIGEAAYGPVAPAVISDLYPVKKRGQVLAWFYLAIPVGSALGYALGGLVNSSSLGVLGARELGVHAENWQWAFYLVVPPGLLLGIWSLFMREPTRGRADLAHGLSPAKARWRDYIILLRTPSYVLCTLGMTAMTFAMGGIAFWMPYYLQNLPHAPSEATVTFGAVSCLAGLLATPLGGIVGDKLRGRFSGSYFLVSGIAMLMGFPFILLTLKASFPWLWVWIFVSCFCLFFNTGPTNTILANVSHPGIRAAGFALNIFVIHALGDVLSPVVIGILGDRYGMKTGFMVVSAMFLVAGVLWLLGCHHLARDTELAPHRLAAAHPLGSAHQSDEA